MHIQLKKYSLTKRVVIYFVRLQAVVIILWLILFFGICQLEPMWPTIFILPLFIAQSIWAWIKARIYIHRVEFSAGGVKMYYQQGNRDMEIFFGLNEAKCEYKVYRFTRDGEKQLVFINVNGTTILIQDRIEDWTDKKMEDFPRVFNRTMNDGVKWW